jgi:hypothetical protein
MFVNMKSEQKMGRVEMDENECMFGWWVCLMNDLPNVLSQKMRKVTVRVESLVLVR